MGLRSRSPRQTRRTVKRRRGTQAETGTHSSANCFWFTLLSGAIAALLCGSVWHARVNRPEPGNESNVLPELTENFVPQTFGGAWRFLKLKLIQLDPADAAQMHLHTLVTTLENESQTAMMWQRLQGPLKQCYNRTARTTEGTTCYHLPPRWRYKVASFMYS